jgi:Raf kinase inhibitor-like YbhB/YbcL family protein
LPAAALLILASCQAGGADLPAERISQPEETSGEAARAAMSRKSEVAAMQLTSPAFTHEGDIPRKHTCDGEDSSPALSWSDSPDGVKSYALIMDDPDAPPGTWVHWVLYNLPAGEEGLPQGVPKQERLDSGAVHGKCWGVDSFSRIGYFGPCPPPGAPHRYYFRLYALDAKLDLPNGATKDQVLAAMEGHILGQAELMGRYGR